MVVSFNPLDRVKFVQIVVAFMIGDSQDMLVSIPLDRVKFVQMKLFSY